MAVVTLLASIDEPTHLTAPDIHTRLTSAGHDLDASTVYRSLVTLVEIGVLHATACPDQPSSYGLAGTPHHHAVCTICGQLREIPASPLRAAVDQAARISNYQLTDDSLLLTGICPTCRGVTTRPPAHPTRH